MRPKAVDEMALRRYLLGELSEEEQARLEERLLTEKEYFERLILAEDDLIDDYVRGKLSGQDREKVEQRFLSSLERQERLELARDLRRYASERAGLPRHERGFERPRNQQDGTIPLLAAPRKRTAIVLLAGTALLLIGGAVGSLLEMARLRGRIDGPSQEQARAQQREEGLREQLAEQLARGEQLSHELERERSRRVQLEQALSDLKHRLSAGERATDTGFASLALDPGRVRDAGRPSIIEIPPSAKGLRLRLSLEQDGYKSYRAVLQTDEGKRIWNRDGLRARRAKDDQRIEVTVPAKLLVPGDYTILLSPTAGRERIGTYYFTVVKKR